MALVNYQGIDYGNGITNIDNETGIRFGVIPHHEVGSAWYEESEAEYGDPSCPECDSAPEDYDDEAHKDYKIDPYTCSAEYVCEECKMIFDSEQAYPREPLSFTYQKDGYAMEQLDEVDIFISKSPYFTYAQFCSPCAPGAGYLMDPTPNGPKTYCLHHDWFEDGQAPYPVYSVETNKEITP
jgi:hypothetical protein